MSSNLDIRVPRNGSYFQEWQLCDADGEPIQLGGSTLEMDARPIAGGGSVIASATLTLTIGDEGRFSVLWNGSDFAALGVPTEITRAAYDLKRTTDGIPEIPISGHIILIPGVTT